MTFIILNSTTMKHAAWLSKRPELQLKGAEKAIAFAVSLAMEPYIEEYDADMARRRAKAGGRPRDANREGARRTRLGRGAASNQARPARARPAPAPAAPALVAAPAAAEQVPGVVVKTQTATYAAWAAAQDDRKAERAEQQRKSLEAEAHARAQMGLAGAPVATGPAPLSDFPVRTLEAPQGVPAGAPGPAAGLGAPPDPLGRVLPPPELIQLAALQQGLQEGLQAQFVQLAASLEARLGQALGGGTELARLAELGRSVERAEAEQAARDEVDELAASRDGSPPDGSADDGATPTADESAESPNAPAQGGEESVVGS